MRVKFVEEPRPFMEAKKGLAREDSEDAYGLPPCVGADTVRVAVADGATQAFRSGQWAAILVSHFVHGRNIQQITPRWLMPASCEFRIGLDIAALPWHSQEKAGRGSFAAFLGLTIDTNRGRYRVISVGDSCIAVVSDQILPPDAWIFPINLTDPTAFTDSPYLVGSNPTYNAHLLERQAVTSWRRLPPSTTQFFLMTDALAAWFSASRIQGDRPWERLASIKYDTDFADLVTDLRSKNQMRDDDVTFVRLSVAGLRGE